MKRYFVYLILYDNGYLYTGYTNHLHRRTRQHYQRGFHAKVIWRQCFYDQKEALAHERQIKGWTRNKKLALAEGRIDNLEFLAKRKPTQQKILTAQLLNQANLRSAKKASPEVPASSKAGPEGQDKPTHKR
jgi:putative endonuclease